MDGIWARALKPLGSNGMSFAASQYYPERLLWLGRKCCIAVGTAGKTNICSLLAFRFGRKEIAGALAAAQLVGGDLQTVKKMPSWRARVVVANGMINSRLAETPHGSGAGPASHVVAHEIAGFGLLSLIMEEMEGPFGIDVSRGSGKITIRHPAFGMCKTNMRFVNDAYLMDAISNLAKEVCAQKENNEVDIAISSDLQYNRTVKERIGGVSIISRQMPFGIKAQAEALAYLWMALDSGSNLFVSCSKAQAPAFLNALGRLLPNYHKNALLGSPCEPSPMPGFIQVDVAGTMHPVQMHFDRLFCIGADAAKAKSLFKAAMCGIPIVFAAGSDAAKAPSTLTQKPYSVEPAHVALLDLSVTLSENGNIDSIMEYRWPSMAEAPYKDNEPFGIAELCRNGALDYNAVAVSKVIRRYSKLNALSMVGAIEELRKRASHLSGRQSGVAEYRIGRLWKPARAAKA